MEISQQFVIDCLNSVQVDSCLLASSYEDLATGIPLCDLLAYSLGQKELISTRRSGFEGTNNLKNSIHNIDIVLRILQMPWQASEVLRSPGLLLSVYNEVLKLSDMQHQDLYKSEAKEYNPVSFAISFPRNTKRESSDRVEVFDWLKYLNIVPKNCKLRTVPSLFANGLLFAEVINRYDIEIKGMNKNTDKESLVKANIRKVLAFLKDKPKFNSVYTWNNEEILRGDEVCIWGLLKDIQGFYQKNPIPQNPGLKIQKVFIPEESSISIHEKNQIKDWLASLDLAHLLKYTNRHFLQDPLRNGVLLAEIVNTFEDFHDFNPSPSSVDDIRGNLKKSLGVLLRKGISLPSSVIGNPDGIIQGSKECTWGLLQALSKQYNSMDRKSSQTTDCLPYSSQDIKKLQRSLLEWISGYLKTQYRSFKQIIYSINDILPKLVSKICQIELNFRPEDKDAIEKILAKLQQDPRMSLKFVWEAKAISDGHIGYITGLLEDLHRMHDGAPPRRRGINYHRDGPYYGIQTKRKYLSSGSMNSDRYPFKSIKVNRSLDWVYDRLGLSKVIIGEDWKDGVLLCKLVSILEKKQIDVDHTKTHQAFVGNVQKALKFVHARSKNFYSQEKIINGNSYYIQGLVQDIGNLYKIY